ncbi:hypothetical protein A10D4_04155 [Idiomarina xiamenensis 10-D-4]|uniref:Uncharacterized protein n=2 Tax=Idiomarina xiamenensis TaxID=1207041 RepID=K2L4M3_9GAMM|nr:hypothetical protein A10D4_04155 [Idiomarina xiamenensis 10-D-4]
MNGAAGVLVSGLVWAVAALLAATSSLFHGQVALLIGGMFIFPLSIVLCKLCKHSGQHAKTNGLAALAIESTIIMLIGIVLAIAVGWYRADWFFPAMLVVIGSRYLLFQSLYGLRRYWLLGGLLCGLGIAAGALVLLSANLFPPSLVAALGALAEILFALLTFRSSEY